MTSAIKTYVRVNLHSSIRSVTAYSLPSITTRLARDSCSLQLMLQFSRTEKP